MEARQRAFVQKLTPELRRELAQTLGVPESCLASLSIGWKADDAAGPCWTFAEIIPGQGVCGLLRRWRNGQKKSESGGQRGLYYGADLHLEDEVSVYCAEGPSDHLVLRTMGLQAVCRFSNSGGADLVAEIVLRSGKRPKLIILGEYDPKPDGKWPGKDGCINVSRSCAAKVDCPIFWAMPPDGAKDVRAWFQQQHADLSCQDELHELGRRFEGLLQLQAARGQSANDTDTGSLARWQAPIPLTVEYESPPFPINCLPGWLADFVKAEAQSL